MPDGLAGLILLTRSQIFGPLGIESMSPIPVHILVDPMGKTRCVVLGSERRGLRSDLVAGPPK